MIIATAVTAMDIECIVAEFIAEGYLRELTIDEMTERGAWLQEMQDFARASQMYRAIISLDPTRADAVKELGHLLAHLGAGPEAAQCYTELVNVFLQEDRIDEALSVARAASDFYYTPHTVFVSSLLDCKDENQAVVVLLNWRDTC